MHKYGNLSWSETDDTINIEVQKSALATDEAMNIVKHLLPNWLDMFIDKNRQYRAVGNDLGARGVFPDINRKTKVLKSRVWDGSPTSDGNEDYTEEVIDDLIGHLFLMRAIMLAEEEAGQGSDGWELMPEDIQEHLRNIGAMPVPSIENFRRAVLAFAVKPNATEG